MNNNELYNLIRRALAAQVEMGFDSLIIGKKADLSSLPSDEVGLPMNETVSEVVTVNQALGKIPVMETSTSFASLDKHFQAICNCTLCPLGKTRNKFVYGVGNPKAEVMFIGEAPGAKEDALGEPFVGRAGELLDKILAAIQFSRKDIYIANILKCRPPENRDPKPEEMELCFPYLKEQIALIKPKIICALGRVAAQALLETTTPLGKLRNVWHTFENVPMLVTYHPAALLRFSSYKRDTWEDMKKLKARYDNL